MMAHRDACGYIPRRRGDGWYEFDTKAAFVQHLTAHGLMVRDCRSCRPVMRVLLPEQGRQVVRPTGLPSLGTTDETWARTILSQITGILPTATTSKTQHQP